MRQESFPRIHENQENLADRFKQLIEIVRNFETRLGEGEMAIIHHDTENPDYTYKVIKDTNAQKYLYPYNDTNREMEIATEIRKYDTETVRTPMQYGIFSVFGKKKIDVLTMERIHGNSIKDVIEGKAKLPEGFDIELYFKKLEDHLAILHKNNLFHRDLHEGNIMFEQDTHMPVIIDFGNSAEVMQGEDPYLQSKPTGETIRFPDDQQSLERAKQKLLGSIDKN